MTAIKITWIYEPKESLSFNLGRDQKFVDEIGRRAGVNIPLLESRLCEVLPADGFVLLNSFDPHDAIATCAADWRQDLASRVIPIDVSPNRIFTRVLEGRSFPAAVDYGSHLDWSRPTRGSTATVGLYGLRTVGERIGAICDAEKSSENYCYLTSTRHEGLPHLLAEYLIALHELRSRPSS